MSLIKILITGQLKFLNQANELFSVLMLSPRSLSTFESQDEQLLLLLADDLAQQLHLADLALDQLRLLSHSGTLLVHVLHLQLVVLTF